MRFLVFLCCLMVFPSAAFAQDCTSGAIDARQVGADDYDPNDLSRGVVRISLRLVEDCKLTNLRIVPRDSNKFELASAGAILQSILATGPQIDARNPSQVVVSPFTRRDLEDGDEITLDLLNLEPGQFVRTGSYQLTIDFVSGPEVLGTLVLNMVVSPTVRLVGESEGGNIDVDLGRLNDGVSTQRSVYFRTNAQVTLQVISDNGGTLVHERGAQFGSIAYASSLNGSTINTSSPTSVSVPSIAGQLTETVVGIEVAPVPSAFAGVYLDVITLSFTAQ